MVRPVQGADNILFWLLRCLSLATEIPLSLLKFSIVHRWQDFSQTTHTDETLGFLTSMTVTFSERQGSQIRVTASSETSIDSFRKRFPESLAFFQRCVISSRINTSRNLINHIVTSRRFFQIQRDTQLAETHLSLLQIQNSSHSLQKWLRNQERNIAYKNGYLLTAHIPSNVHRNDHRPQRSSGLGVSKHERILFCALSMTARSFEVRRFRYCRNVSDPIIVFAKPVSIIPLPGQEFSNVWNSPHPRCLRVLSNNEPCFSRKYWDRDSFLGLQSQKIASLPVFLGNCFSSGLTSFYSSFVTL